MSIQDDAIKITYFIAFIIGFISGYIKDFIIFYIPEKNVINQYNTIANIDFLIQ